MQCPSCSHPNDDSKKFCSKCGASLSGNRCANGHTIPDGLDECPFCPRSPAPNVGGQRGATEIASDLPGGGAPAPAAGGGGPRKTMHVSPTKLESSGVVPGRAGRGETVGSGPPQVGAAPGGSAPASGKRGRTMFRDPSDAAAEAPGAASPQGGAPAQNAPSSSGSRLVGFLVSFSVDRNGISWPLRFGRTTVGSSLEQDVVLLREGVSTIHAEVMVRLDKKAGIPKIWVTDKNSMNGTTYNGDDIFNEDHVLSHGDIVGISDVELMVILLPTME